MPHSVFLRSECTLPDQLGLSLEPVGNDWMLAEKIVAPDLDTMIRRAGWHFMYVQGTSSRTSVALTGNEAIHHALARALKGIASRFNAAELESIKTAKYAGFHLATVILQPRQIQHYTALDNVDKSRVRAALAR
jgi:hypothetical protein